MGRSLSARFSPVITQSTTMLYIWIRRVEARRSDNGPKRGAAPGAAFHPIRETRRCGANLTLVHRKRRRFLRGDRRSRYIIARLVVSSGARGDIQPLLPWNQAATTLVSHHRPAPYPLTSSFHVELVNLRYHPRDTSSSHQTCARCSILFSASLADIWFSLIPLRRSPVIREKLLSPATTSFLVFFTLSLCSLLLLLF